MCNPHLPRSYVYGKAYVEFFCSPEAWATLRAKLDAAPSITYLATTAAGSPAGNMAPDAVNAVTWGVFPGGWIPDRSCGWIGRGL